MISPYNILNIDEYSSREQIKNAAMNLMKDISRVGGATEYKKIILNATEYLLTKQKQKKEPEKEPEKELEKEPEKEQKKKHDVRYYLEENNQTEQIQDTEITEQMPSNVADNFNIEKFNNLFENNNTILHDSRGYSRYLQNGTESEATIIDTELPMNIDGRIVKQPKSAYNNTNNFFTMGITSRDKSISDGADIKKAFRNKVITDDNIPIRNMNRYMMERDFAIKKEKTQYEDDWEKQNNSRIENKEQNRLNNIKKEDKDIKRNYNKITKILK